MSNPAPAGLDFKLLFERAPGANLVLDSTLRIVAASDDYLRVTMTSREEILGRGAFEVFPDEEGGEDAEGPCSASARASFLRVLKDGKADSLSIQRYPIPRRPEHGGGFEERFWKTINFPICADDGQTAFVLHHTEDVTDVVRLEQAQVAMEANLRELTTRSDRFMEILDSAPDATVIVGEDGRIQLVNRLAESLFDYAREELLGMPLEVLIPERFRKDHGLHVHRYFEQPGQRPMASGIELFGRRKDGTEMPIEVSLSPQRSPHGVTVSAAIRDISERKRLEAAARVTSQRLASAVESIQDAFALFDSDDRLILCNSVYRRLFDHTLPGKLVGKSFTELVDVWIGEMCFDREEARARFRDEWLARRRTHPTSTIEVRLKDGRYLRVSDRRTAEGGIVKTIWDLTEDEEHTKELLDARAAAETASAAKSDFLSSMSHELRTPLNAILGFAQLLVRDKREPLSPRHRERVGHILHGGEHLLRLIDDVLDLSRIESGRVSISTEAVSVVEVLEEVSRTLEPMARRYGVDLERLSVPSELPMIAVDRIRFAQILMNFGSNAVKYNRARGAVRFTVTRVSEDRIRVMVSDTGMGIPADKQEKLFQPFQRAGQETGPIEGTGIGLVITKRLVELMGGTVGFRSVPGEGSSFWVDMPITSTPEAVSAPRPHAERVERVPPLEYQLVLHVEDNPANVNFMRDLMSSFPNVELVTVPTAELGVEFARARRPKAIIMDINLPGMSGVDALRILRQLPETADVPVIAVTAAASERDKQRGVEAGFYRYLTKPIVVDAFFEALESLLLR